MFIFTQICFDENAFDFVFLLMASLSFEH
jgi:hypothetical protein